MKSIVNDLDKTLYDAKTALDKAKERIISLSKEDTNLKVSDSKDQLFARVYAEHFYEENSQDFKDYKSNKQSLKESITIFISKHNKPEGNPPASFVADKVINIIEEEFKKFKKKLFDEKYGIPGKNKNGENTTKANINAISNIIEKAIIKASRNYDKNDLKELYIDISEKVFKHYDGYNYMEDNSGYLVGIFKNNGDFIEKKEVSSMTGNTRVVDYYDKNLVSLSFVRKRDVAIQDKIEKTMLSVVFSTVPNELFSLGAMKILEKSGFSNIVTKLKNLNGWKKKGYDTSKNVRSLAIYTKSLEYLNIQNSFMKELEDLNEVYKQIDFNRGINEDTKKILDTISIIFAIIPIMELNIASAIILGPVLEALDSAISWNEGEEIISRFKASKKNEDVIIENSINKNPPYINYNGETKLPTVVADGNTTNKVILDRGDNYIKAINGNNNILSGGSGNDTIIGYEGVDIIDGGNDNDTLTGGKGNDIIYGGSGDNTYIFYKGDGNDLIKEYIDQHDNMNKENVVGDRSLKLKGYKLDDIKDIKVIDKNLKIEFYNSNDSITIEDYKNYSLDSDWYFDQSVRHLEFYNRHDSDLDKPNKKSKIIRIIKNKFKKRYRNEYQ